MKEVWKDVDGYNGKYQISSLGRVKSFKNELKIYLKPGYDYGGYAMVVLSNKSKTKTFRVHRLVGLYFIPNPENKPLINHRNGIKTDNSVKNLEWVTVRENGCHRIRTTKCSSKYIGVSWSKTKNKWSSTIMINGKHRGLGHYDNEIDAYQAYINSLKEHNIKNKYK